MFNQWWGIFKLDLMVNCVHIFGIIATQYWYCCWLEDMLKQLLNIFAWVMMCSANNSLDSVLMESAV
jgi:hypothetical protein